MHAKKKKKLVIIYRHIFLRLSSLMDLLHNKNFKNQKIEIRKEIKMFKKKFGGGDIHRFHIRR